jgi:transposase
MARRTFDVVDVTEIFIHWYAGRSISEVAAWLGVDRKTIRKYLAAAVAAGLAPGGVAMTAQDWAPLVAGWFPQLADTKLRQTTWPQIAEHHEYITAQLKAGVRQATIHQRLRDEHGLAASVASLKRYVAANLPEEVRRDRVVVLRDEADTPPGEEAQIDYGHLGYWIDPVSGKRRRVWAFAMVLACSRHLFVRPVLTMDQAAWTEAHVEAFRFFGGVPRRLVPDNLRTGVDKPDLYDPKLNRSYAELAAHYGTLVDPARRSKPRDKARIERPMPYIRDSLGREFTSVPQMQAAARDWCRDVAGRRSSRPLGGAAPGSVFNAVEAEALQPLPAKPFVLAIWSTARVGPDIHARVGKTIYSVPWRFIGQRVDARATAMMVQFFHNGRLIATHGRKPSGKQTDLGHYPPEKIAFRMRTPTWCRTRADQIGPACTQLVAGLLEVNALFRLRAAQGVLGLADKHGTARLEAACAKAIAVGDPAYRTVKGILVAGAETDPPPPSAGDGGAAAHLHGPSQLFANVIPLPTTGGATGPDPATTSGHPCGTGDDQRPTAETAALA